MEAEGASPVLLVSGVIRGFLANLLRGRMANFYILAYDEIPADKNIRVVTTIGKQAPQREGIGTLIAVTGENEIFLKNEFERQEADASWEVGHEYRKICGT